MGSCDINKPMTRSGLAALLTFTIGLTGCPGVPDRSGRIPEPVLRLNTVGTSLLSQQSWTEAQKAFGKALESRPDDPVLLVNLAVALVQQGRSEEAEQSLMRALEADSGNLHAHYNLGLIEKNRGNAEGAAGHFSQVTEADPDDVATLYNLATALGRLDRHQEAEASFRAALVQNPTHISSLYGLGRLLLQEGNQKEGQELIARSQKIRAQSGVDAAMGTQYGEQGPYAMGVDYPAGGLPAPGPVPVTFQEGSMEALEQEALASQGQHPAWIAMMLEGAKRAFELKASPEDRSALRSQAAGDVDGDGDVELVALLRERRGSRVSWSAVVDQTIIDHLFNFDERQELALKDPGEADHVDITLVDRDHDGDLDLFGCIGGGSGSTCFVADNDGSGRFETYGDTGIEIGAVESGPIRLAFTDYDNDRDIDLIAVEPGGVHLFSNLRDGSFENVSERAGLGGAVPGAVSIDVADLNKDGWMDLVLGTAEGPVLLLNRRGKFPSAQRPAGAQTGSTGENALVLGGRALVLDYDNDGFLDVAAWVGGRLRFFRNLGLEEWEETTDRLLSEALEAEPLTVADFDHDGDLDLQVLYATESLAFLINDGGNTNRWVDIQPRGVRDNKFGIGTKVEVLAGALRQKFEVTRPLPVHAGLGHRRTIDAVRFLWPGGVIQDELDVVGRSAEVAQLDRKGTSCPLLYAWRDGRWRFVTDLLGGCAIGYRHSPDTFSVPDTDEYVKVEGGLSEQDGALRLRLNNQLEEVIWFDQAALIAVDHPEGTQVYPDERLMPGPPWPEFGLFASGDVRPVVSARELESGREVTELLRRNDRRYVDGFELLPFKGYAEMHTLELDLGAYPTDSRGVLLLDGWIDYADSTSNLAAHQAGIELVPPRLYAADGKGGWRDLSGRMGFPAGLPKTMTVDLSEAFVSADRRIRIATTMRIYWDRARLMVGGDQTPLRVRRMKPTSARLGFGGFPAETSPDGRPPFGYDPDRISMTSLWKAHAGAYTAFGDVTELISRVDDRFVTTRGGDQIELWFESPGSLSPGWSRTYLFYADGFGKDMDPNSAASSRVGPVPFHGMPDYPYGPDVAPRASGEEPARPARLVLPGDGLPGVLPLPLVGQRD